MPPKHAERTPWTSLNQNCKMFLKARWGLDMVGCYKVLGAELLCSCGCPQRSGYSCKPPIRYTLYFRERLKQRIWGSAYPGKAPKYPSQWHVNMHFDYPRRDILCNLLVHRAFLSPHRISLKKLFTSGGEEGSTNFLFLFFSLFFAF